MNGLTLRYRVWFNRGSVPRQGAASASSDSSPEVCQAARFLALGHRVDQAVRDGEIKSYAEAARRLSISAARMNHLCQLCLLAPSIQDRLLSGELQISAAALRPIARIPLWREQEKALDILLLPSTA